MPFIKKAILLLMIFVFGKSLIITSSAQTPIYQNPLCTIEDRIEDLLSRMTLKEKVGQMNIPCVYKKRIGWGLEVGEISLHKTMTLEERQTRERKSVVFTLKPEDLSLLDIDLRKIVEPGVFNVMVGSSSADIRLQGSFTVKISSGI